MSDDELYEYLDQKFEWNRAKAARNLLFHGVSFPEAATVFLDKRNITIHDEDHSEEEQRYTVIGLSARARTLLAHFSCFCEPDGLCRAAFLGRKRR